MYLRWGQEYLQNQEMTYLEYEKNTLEDLRNTLRHPAIGKFYLRRTEEGHEYEN